MADITPPLPRNRQLIQRYGGGGFRIGGEDYVGSVLVQPERTFPWQVAEPSAIDFASIASVIEGMAENGAVLLVGTGERMFPLDPVLRTELRRCGIGIEVMDTGAACRTFNVLLAEERAVLAALIAVN